MPTKADPTGERQKRSSAGPASEHFGQEVEKRRKHLSLSVFELAARAGVTPPSIYSIRDGRGCRLETAAKIAAVLGLDLGLLSLPPQ